MKNSPAAFQQAFFKDYTPARETTNVSGTSTQAPACHPAQAPNTGGYGGAQGISGLCGGGGGGIGFYGGAGGGLNQYVSTQYIDPANWFAQQYAQSISGLHAGYQQGALVNAQLASLVNMQNQNAGAWTQIPAGMAAMGLQNAIIPLPALTHLPTEIKAGEIVAWRVWRVEKDGTFSSVHNSTLWEENAAMEAHHPNDVANGYGFHAWKTEQQARDYALGLPDVAIGTVELWGEVVEHDEGYRAQFAQIKDIVERQQNAGGHYYMRTNYGSLGQAPDPPPFPFPAHAYTFFIVVSIAAIATIFRFLIH